jgi:hypothetical protein
MLAREEPHVNMKKDHYRTFIPLGRGEERVPRATAFTSQINTGIYSIMRNAQIHRSSGPSSSHRVLRHAAGKLPRARGRGIFDISTNDFTVFI